MLYKGRNYTPNPEHLQLSSFHAGLYTTHKNKAHVMQQQETAWDGIWCTHAQIGALMCILAQRDNNIDTAHILLAAPDILGDAGVQSRTAS